MWIGGRSISKLCFIDGVEYNLNHHEIPDCKTPCRYLQQSPAELKGKPQNLISHPTYVAFCANALNQRNHQTHKINIKICLKTKSPGILKCTPKERIWRMHQHMIKCSQTNYLKSPGLGTCTKVTSSHHHCLHQVSGWRSYFYNFYLGIWLSNAHFFSLNIA